MYFEFITVVALDCLQTYVMLEPVPDIHIN